MSVDPFTAFLASLPPERVGFLRDIYGLPRNYPTERLHDWLSDPDKLGPPLLALNRFGLTLLEALLALGPGRSRAQLDDALDGRATTEEVDTMLDRLTEVALVWRLPGDRLALNPGLPFMISMPCGLAPAAVDLLPESTVAHLTGLARLFRVEPAQRKAPLVAQAVELLADPAAVAAALGRLSAPAAALAKRMAVPGRPIDVLWQQRRAPGVDELVGSGLMVVLDYTTGVLVREAALAIRAGRIVLEVQPQAPVVGEVSAGRPDGAQAAAAAVTDLQALLSAVATTPVALIGSGAVGAKEIKRLMKGLSLTEQQVVLLLGLADDAGLLQANGATAQLSPAAGNFAALPPVEQWIGLATTWQTSGSPYISGTAPLTREERRPPRELPPSLLLTVLQVDRRLTPRNVRTVLTWQVPLLSFDASAEIEIDAAMTEAELLGLVLDGLLTPAGAALGSGDLVAAGATFNEAFATQVDEVILQGDLTATTTGPPSVELARLLDGAADRETRGHASVWRFSATSIRRYLDAGHSADSLLAGLAAKATRGVPNALTALVGDAARRQGEVEVHTALTVLVARDAAIAATLLNDRKLAKLALAAVTDTVLISPADEAAVIELVRKSGFSPSAVRSGPPVVSADLEKLVRTAMRGPRTLSTALLKLVRAGQEATVELWSNGDLSSVRLRDLRVDSVYLSGTATSDGSPHRYRLSALYGVTP